MTRLLLLVCFGCLGFGLIKAQGKDTKALAASALTKFKAENYDEALDDYLQLVTDEPKNPLYNYNLGVCYLNSNGNKAKAIPYLEIAVRADDPNPKGDFLLGRAYQYGNRFDDALKSFDKYLEKVKKDDPLLKDLGLEVQHCINGKEVTKFPIDVTFQNLGKNVNSGYADYYPFITENEGFMVYNSKRPKSSDAHKYDNGQYANSVYISKVENGEYSEAKLIGEPVCAGNSGEEIIGMSAKGDILVIYKASAKGQGKIYLSRQLPTGNYSKLEALPDVINETGEVISACINNDASTIYFASYKKDGFGGTDLYSCNKLPTGKWSKALNMGPEINTKYDEDFPNLSPDGKTFYFSSKGHSSMGGYDIFKASFDEETRIFGKPLNIGYPVNTSYDDLNFRISKNGRYGYVASLRGGGLGDFDIYRVTFNEVEVENSIFIGNIIPKDSANKVDYRSTYLTVTSNSSGETIGNYVPNPETGRFIIVLPPGKYSLICEAPGYKEYTRPLEVLDKISYQPEINIYVELKN